MKNFTKIIAPVVALAVGFTSCDKVPTTTTPTTTTPTTTTPTAPTPVTPTIAGNYSGMMAAIQMEFTYNMAMMPFPVSIESDMGVATFYSTPGGNTMVDAGAITLNESTLKRADNNSYSLLKSIADTPSTLNMGSSVRWTVAGSGAVTAFNHTWSSSFPDYTGTLPATVTKSAGLDVDLGSKVSGADSVYVLVIGFSGKQIMKSYPGSSAPAKASFTASELSGFSAAADTSAYIEVVPFTYKVNTSNGKNYVYVKEKAVISMVSLK